MSNREPKFKVGDFAFHRIGENEPSLVKIAGVNNETERGPIYHIHYTQGTDLDAVEAPIRISGGASFWWNEDEFIAIDDPILLLRCAMARIDSEIAAAKSALERAQQERLHYHTSLRLIAESRARDLGGERG